MSDRWQRIQEEQGWNNETMLLLAMRFITARPDRTKAFEAYLEQKANAELVDEEKADKFTRDMLEAGYDVREYEGRGGYEGPAVVCKRGEEQDVIRATTMQLQVDNMGKGFVLYPR